ncbi:phosphatase 2C-like domain-containing protein [Chytriomyces sp. MP71]|nr:phosphatase 2C-like domain-containing protein [Chytriomyces sp. MP71]
MVHQSGPKPLFESRSVSIEDDDETSPETSLRGSTVATASASATTPLVPNAEQRRLEASSGFHVGVSEDRNKRYRRTMEDAHTFLFRYGGEDGQGFFAIFDGHAGKVAAEWCGKNLHETLLKLIRERPDAPIPHLFNEAFVETDKQLASKKVSSGCTAVAALVRIEDRRTGENDALVRKRVLYTANVGDARAVLSRNGRALRLSYDHKGSDAHEKQRIMESGGFVVNGRVNGVLAVTRALGDLTMKDYIIGNPYTTETVLEDADDTLLLACDGVWDVCSDQDAIDFLVAQQDRADTQAAADDLLALALEKLSTDNLTVMVVRFSDVKTVLGSLTDE